MSQTKTEIHSNFFQLSSRQSLDQNEKVGSQSPAECLGGDDEGRCFREARQGVSFRFQFRRHVLRHHHRHVLDLHCHHLPRHHHSQISSTENLCEILRNIR